MQAGARAGERAGWTSPGELPANPFAPPALPFTLPSERELQAAYEAHPAERSALLAQADGVLEGRFAVLGFESLSYNSPTDWHLDPVHGRRAPLLHWSRVPYLDASVVGDHKIVWELNRHQFLPVLGIAWRLTGEARYAEGAARLLEQWMDANPPRQGINWVSSLELAFRLVAWTWALHLFHGADLLRQPLRERMLRFIDLQARHVARYLSTWFSPNTHLTGEALALLYTGCAFPGFSRAEAWRGLGERILREQLPIQVREDGTYFEQTTWYHAYTIDFYLHALCLARQQSLSGWESLVPRITRAVEVLQQLVNEDGRLPLVGDDDGGRLLPLTPGARGDFRDTLALAATVLDKPRYCLPSDAPAAQVLLGSSPATPERPEGVKAIHASLAFPDAGWYLLRTSAGQMLVDAGPHGGLSSGGHAHADALSVTLRLPDREVLIDAGTRSYVGPERDRFRGTSAHNTLCVAGHDSSKAAGPFRWTDWTQTATTNWFVGPEQTLLSARAEAYRHLWPGFVHERAAMACEGMGWLVLDRVKPGGADPSLGAVLRWHVAPELTISRGEDASVVLTCDGTPVMLVASQPQAPLRSESGEISRLYGVSQPSGVLVQRLSVGAMAEAIATAFVPISGDGAEIVGLAVSDAGWRWEVGSRVLLVRWPVLGTPEIRLVGQ